MKVVTVVIYFSDILTHLPYYTESMIINSIFIICLCYFIVSVQFDWYSFLIDRFVDI